VIVGKPVSLPSWLELIVGGLISTAALALFLRSLNRLRRNVQPKQAGIQPAPSPAN
jgi:hypothetical protein